MRTDIDPEEGNIRLIPASPDGNEAPYKNASRDARREFLQRLEFYGFTVLPDTQRRWWKDAE